MHPQADRVFCAVDTADEAVAADLAGRLAEVVGGVKLGLEFFLANGPAAVARVAAGRRLFLDLKLHDIPNTVAGAAAAAADLGVAMLTVHASGGPAMIAAAARAAPDVAILAVTVLTSLDDAVLAAVGQQGVDVQVPRLAHLAIEAGAAGIVCAPGEVRRVRAAVGPRALVVVPGIRPAGTGADDQARVATPAEAWQAGASHLVVGRPLTQAPDPAAAARQLLADLPDHP